MVGERLLVLVHGIRHRLAYEREVEASAFLGHVPDDLHLVVDDLPRGVGIEEDQEFRGARAEPDVSKETRRPVRPGRTNRLIAGPTPNSGSRR